MALWLCYWWGVASKFEVRCVPSSSTTQDFDGVIQDHTFLWSDTVSDLRHRISRGGCALIPDITPGETEQAARGDHPEPAARR